VPPLAALSPLGLPTIGLPDPSALESSARAFAGLAEYVRARAVRLTAEADAARWRSTAANAFRHKVSDLARDLRRCAELLDEASCALLAHAEQVRHTEQLFANTLNATLNGTKDVLDTTGHVLASGASGTVHAAERIWNWVSG
jgi:uncharacterized protein YukE